MSKTDSLEELVDKCHIATTKLTLQSSASTPNSTVSVKGKGKARRAKSSALIRFSTNIEKRRRQKQHYLLPIGSFKETGISKQPIKWVDVASIIDHGVDAHKSLDPIKFRENYERLSTISSGTLTSMIVKEKAYSVFPVLNSMISLEDLLKLHEKSSKTIFQETHAKFVCANIMMALRFLHEHKIFHGSVCPQKIVFNERAYPCLTGFGTADIIDDRQSRPRERTQFEYTSPEQLWWEYITEATDIFSTGCVTYALLYGKPPHHGSDTQITRRNLNDKHFEANFPPGTISRPGRKFIAKCIRKRESRRYSILETKDMFEDIHWFSGLKEEKLYKQSIPSPLIYAIQTASELSHK